MATPAGYGSIRPICCTIDPMSRLRLALVTVILCTLELSDLSAQSKKSKKDGVPAVPGAAAKTPGAVAIDPKSFVIGPEDVLWIRVWNSPNLSNQVTVRPDG